MTPPDRPPFPFVHRAGALLAQDITDTWGTISWLTDGERHGIGATVGYVEIGPGEQNPRHIHPNCQEILVLLEGRLAHEVDEEVVELDANDVLVVPAGAVHRAKNVGPRTARMVVVYDSGTRGFVTVE